MRMKSRLEQGTAHLDNDLFDRTMSLSEPQDLTPDTEALSGKSDESCDGV